jgi:hypothetical protein
MMVKDSLRALVATAVTALTLVACESRQEGTAVSQPTPPAGLEQALTYEVLQSDDISSRTRRRVRAFIYSPAESIAARVQTSMKAAVEIQRDTGCDFVKVFHLILPDPNQIGLGTYYVDLAYAPDGLGVSGEAPLRMGKWEAMATDEVVDDLTLEVEGLWWSNLQRFQRPDGYGGTETDEEAMKGFIAKELQVEPEDVKLARLWLELYHPET